METIERKVGIQASRAAIWRFLADFTNSPAWNPSSISVQLATGNGANGTIYQGLRRLSGALNALESERRG